MANLDDQANRHEFQMALERNTREGWNSFLAGNGSGPLAQQARDFLRHMDERDEAGGEAAPAVAAVAQDEGAEHEAGRA